MSLSSKRKILHEILFTIRGGGDAVSCKVQNVEDFNHACIYYFRIYYSLFL